MNWISISFFICKRKGEKRLQEGKLLLLDYHFACYSTGYNFQSYQVAPINCFQRFHSDIEIIIILVYFKHFFKALITIY